MAQKKQQAKIVCQRVKKNKTIRQNIKINAKESETKQSLTHKNSLDHEKNTKRETAISKSGSGDERSQNLSYIRRTIENHDKENDHRLGSPTDPKTFCIERSNQKPVQSNIESDQGDYDSKICSDSKEFDEFDTEQIK